MWELVTAAALGGIMVGAAGALVLRRRRPMANALHHERDQVDRLRSELRMCSTELQQTQQIAGIGTWACDIDGDQWRWSQGLQRLLGFSDEMVRTVDDAAELIHPEDRERFRKDWLMLRRYGPTEPGSRIYRLFLPDGSIRRIAVRATREPGGQRLVGTVQDRGAGEGADQQRQQAGRMEALGQLAAGIAHDFNNQLGGILGFAEILQRNPDHADRQRLLDSIVRAAGSAADLTTQLLAFARRGRQVEAAIPIADMVRSTVSLARRTMPRGVRIELETQPLSGLVRGDPSMVENALLNLILNARDAMPQGGVIAVSVVAEAYRDLEPSIRTGLGDGEQAVAISVSDEGSGIPAVMIERVCEPFYTTKENGTGMGLAAVAGTVDDHEGHLRIESQEGRGSTFTMRFPLRAGNDHGPKRLPQRPRQRALRALLIDEHSDSTRVHADLLRTLGHAASACNDVADALDLLSAHPRAFDVALIDQQVGHFDVLSLATALRERNPKIAVVVAAGDLTPSARDACHRADATAILDKPLRLHDLSDVMHQIAERRISTGDLAGD